MFPNSMVKWHPFSSIIDGQSLHLSLCPKACGGAAQNLIMLECVPDTRAYGIGITHCLVYCAFDEMIYSIAEHGDKNA